MFLGYCAGYVKSEAPRLEGYPAGSGKFCNDVCRCLATRRTATCECLKCIINCYDRNKRLGSIDYCDLILLLVTGNRSIFILNQVTAVQI